MNERPKVIHFASVSGRHDHRWTDDELKQLMAMWLSGTELGDIAHVFGVGTHAINKQIYRMRSNGIPIPRRNSGHRAGRANQLWTAEEVEYLVRRRNERAPCESIANELNRSFAAVQAMLQELKKQGVTVRKFGQGKRRLWDAARLREAVAGRGLSENAESPAEPEPTP